MLNFLTGVEILEEVESRVNGSLRVAKDFAWGAYVQSKTKTGWLTQSGGVVYEVWRSTLRKIRSPSVPSSGSRDTKSEIRNCLILGLGGGSAAKIVRKFWPKAKITGVEIDPIMVELGTRHLGLGNDNVEVVISDALDFILNHKFYILNHFDLILVDLYVGDKVPEKFESEDFFKRLKKLVNKDGIVVFNRLYYAEKRPESVKFGKKLENIFSKVDVVYPEANIMFVCKN
ncbi:MAG: methyltransferase domain-containing protein [Patescibacteria group bacterium]